MKKYNKYLIIFFIFSFVLVFVFYFFKKEEKVVKIGFVGALTEKYSVLGNAMMNGINLAFEEIDYKINDKKIEIIFKDDKKSISNNKRIIKEFIKNDIKIVIGNVTSSMSKVSMEIINKHDDMFMISASSASNEFSKKDDRFFRVHVANNAKRFDSYSKYILKNNYKKVYGVFDPVNSTYTKDYLINFEKSFIRNGGEKLLAYFESDKSLDLLIKDIKEKNPDLLLICANSVDAAKVLQYIRLKGINTKVALSEWAMTDSFLENAGKYSNGVLFNIDYNENSQKKEFLSFVKKYKQQYNKNPSIFASKAYELTKIIIEALKHTDETRIKEYILNKRVFEGLQDKIVFDKYGDIIKSFYSFEVNNGVYILKNEKN